MKDFIRALWWRLTGKHRDLMQTAYDGPLIKDGPGNSSGVFTDYGDGDGHGIVAHGGGGGSSVAGPRYEVLPSVDPAKPWALWDNASDVLVRMYAFKRGAIAAAARMNKPATKYETPKDPLYVLRSRADGTWTLRHRDNHTLVGTYKHKRGAVAAARRMNAAGAK